MERSMTYDEAVAALLAIWRAWGGIAPRDERDREGYRDADAHFPVALDTIIAEVERARGERDKYHKYHLADIERLERAEAALREMYAVVDYAGLLDVSDIRMVNARAALAPNPTEERLRRFARESEGPENPAGGYIQ